LIVDLLYIIVPMILSTASLITTIWIFQKNATKAERKETIDLATKVSEKLNDHDKRLSRVEWELEKDDKSPIKKR
jgi:hypothetical protein